MRLGPRFHPPFRAAGRVRFLHEPPSPQPRVGRPGQSRRPSACVPKGSLRHGHAPSCARCPRRLFPHGGVGGRAATEAVLPSNPRIVPPSPLRPGSPTQDPRGDLGTHVDAEAAPAFGGPRAGTDVSCRLGSDLPRRGDEEASAWISHPPARFLQTSPVDGSGPCSAVVTVGSAGSPRGPFFLVRAAGGPADPVGRASKRASVCFAGRCGVLGPAQPRLRFCGFGYAQSSAVQED